MTAAEFILLFEAGIKANEADSFRRNNLIFLPEQGDVVITGDLHGHRRNFERVCSYASLEANPQRHIIFQEIIHGGAEDAHGGCSSYDLLADVVRLKLQYPCRVHIVLANHDTAFITNSEVMKNGKEMNSLMRAAMLRRFGEDVKAVESAIERFLFSQPLAVRLPNRIWASHSLPADRMMKNFDFGIFERPLRVSDIVRPNSAYSLTWGRRQSSAVLRSFSEKLDIDFFVLGHQVQESGWMTNNENLIIIDSQHNHGYLMTVSLEKLYDIKSLVKTLKPIAAIG